MLTHEECIGMHDDSPKIQLAGAKIDSGTFTLPQVPMAITVEGVEVLRLNQEGADAFMRAAVTLRDSGHVLVVGGKDQLFEVRRG